VYVWVMLDGRESVGSEIGGMAIVSLAHAP
jgi:hypothetical protein